MITQPTSGFYRFAVIQVSIELGTRAIIVIRPGSRGDAVYKFDAEYWHWIGRADAAERAFWREYGFSYADANRIVRGAGRPL